MLCQNFMYIRSYYLLIGRHEAFVYLHIVVWTVTIILQIERQPAKVDHVSYWRLYRPYAVFVAFVTAFVARRLNRPAILREQSSASFRNKSLVIRDIKIFLDDFSKLIRIIFISTSTRTS